MKIDYRKISEYKSVDLKKLRPKNSYKNLIEKRSEPIDQLIRDFGKIPKKLLKVRKCPNCNSSKSRLEIKKDFLKIVRCLSCNLVFTNPIFDEEHYEKLYNSKTYKKIVQDLGEASHLYRKERFGNERIQTIKQFFKKNKVTYLDIGCSTGFVVEAAKDHGWNATGIDLNKSAVDFGKRRDLNLFNVDLFNINFKNKFDVITLYDVLEHLVNPKKTILKVKKLLKKNGLVHLYVPNYNSASRILMGKEAHFIWPSHHLTYYTIETISDFLEKRGFDIIDIKTEGLDIFDYIWWQINIDNKKNKTHLEKISDKLQFFINAGGYGKNLRVLARKK